MTKIISKAVRDSAKGEECTLRLSGCLDGGETTVLAHLPGTGMKGFGMKVPDICACYACQNCHDIIDGRTSGEWDYRDVVRAMSETLVKLVEKRIVTVKGVKL